MTIPYVGSTREQLYKEIKRLEQSAIAGDGSLNQKVNYPRAEAHAGTCDGLCSDTSRKHLRMGAAGWTFVEGKKSLGVAGTLITFCPYCGRKLK